MSDHDIRTIERRAALVDTPLEKLRALRAVARVNPAPPIVADPDERRIPLPAGYDETNSIVISASQIETWLLCGRKWLGEKVFKLPVPPKGFLTFGTTLHAVCERFLKADDLGRVDCPWCFEGSIPCWTTLDGKTACDDCAVAYTGSRPVRFKPRNCSYCAKPIVCGGCAGTGRSAVNLYPLGWDAEISKVEADLIQKLVAKGIQGDDKGRPVLTRHPRRRIKHGFLRMLCQVGGITVFVTGWIDYLRPFVAVEDHKTTKDLRWAKKEDPDSPDWLGKSRQMLIYARELLVQAEEAGEFPPDEILLQHNYYCKNPSKPSVKVVQAVVSVERVLAHWEELKTIAAEIVGAKHRFRDLNYWHDFPLPTSQARACEAFGGCAYRTVCGGLETPFRYMTRQQESVNVTQQTAAPAAPGINGSVPTGPAPIGIRRMPAPPPPPAPTPQRSFNVIDPMTEQVRVIPENELRALVAQHGNEFFVLLEGEVSQSWKSPADYGIVAPAQQPQAPPPAPMPQQAARPTPPDWFMPGCGACGTSPHPGFNTQGNPCRICYGTCAPENHPNNFDIITQNGAVTWTRKQAVGQAPAPQPPVPQAPPQQQAMPAAVPAAAITVQGAAPTPEATPKRGPGRPRRAQADAAAQAQAQAPAPQAPQAPAPIAPVPTAPAAQTPAPRAETWGGQAAQTPRGKFVLLVNCVLERGDGPSMDLADSLAKWGGLLAESRKVQSYYHLDTFERRNLVAGEVAQIAAELDGYVVARADKGSDLAALVSALRPYASAVVGAAA